jgi:AraC-like DNA-binding protein
MGLAYDSGFNSKTVFNNYFKKETGITPKEFLKG